MNVARDLATPRSSPADATDAQAPVPVSPLAGVAWSLGLVALLVYIFVITSFRLGIGDVAMAAAIASLAFQRGGLRLPAVIGWLGAYVVWCGIGYARTIYPGVVWEQFVLLVKLWLIVLVVVNVLRTRAQIRIFTVFFLGCFALFPVRGTFLNYFAGYTDFGRAIWNNTFANSNDLAALALLQLSMGFGLVVSEPRGWVRRCAVAGLATLPLLILMTQSRAAFLGLTVFLLFVVLGQRRRLRALAVTVSAGSVIALAAPAGVWERVGGLTKATSISSLSDVDPEGSAEQRFRIWLVARDVIRDHPLFGVGIGAYPDAHFEYATLLGPDHIARGRRDAHSTYLTVLAENGILGLVLFAMLFGTTMLGAERARRRARMVLPRSAQQLFYLELGLLGFFVAAIFGSYGRLSFTYIHLALLWSCARATRDELARLARA